VRVLRQLLGLASVASATSHTAVPAGDREKAAHGPIFAKPVRGAS
jgi:hypothetical protein